MAIYLWSDKVPARILANTGLHRAIRRITFGYHTSFLEETWGCIEIKLQCGKYRSAYAVKISESDVISLTRDDGFSTTIGLDDVSAQLAANHRIGTGSLHRVYYGASLDSVVTAGDSAYVVQEQAYGETVDLTVNIATATQGEINGRGPKPPPGASD